MLKGIHVFDDIISLEKQNEQAEMKEGSAQKSKATPFSVIYFTT